MSGVSSSGQLHHVPGFIAAAASHIDASILIHDLGLNRFFCIPILLLEKKSLSSLFYILNKDKVLLKRKLRF